jgi:beta-glucosidase-like glycosyl hydrolase
VLATADKVKPSERLYANNSSLIGAPAHRAVARQAVRESLVLLKNSDNILPLDRNLDVLVAGNAANDIGKQSGGWSVSWQGLTNTNNSFPGGTSIYQGISQWLIAQEALLALVPVATIAAQSQMLRLWYLVNRPTLRVQAIFQILNIKPVISRIWLYLNH